MTASFVAAYLMDSLGRRSLMIMSFSGMVRFSAPGMRAGYWNPNSFAKVSKSWALMEVVELYVF